MRAFSAVIQRRKLTSALPVGRGITTATTEQISCKIYQ